MVLFRDNGTGLLKDWIQNISATDKFGSVPYEWNPKTKRFQLKGKLHFKLFNVRLLFGFLYWILALFQVIMTWDESSILVITHSVLFLNAYFQSLTSCYVNLKERKGIIALNNNLIEYEKLEGEKNDVIHENGKITAKGLLIKYLIQMQASTGVFMPILYHLDIIRNPCYPMYTGYWLSDQCQGMKIGVAKKATWSSVEIWTKVGISLVSYANWTFVFTGYCYNVAAELLLYGHCFCSYISEYGRKMMAIKKVDGKTEKWTMKFRKLQLMLVYYREFYSKSMLSTLVVCLMIIETLCLYNSVSAVRSGTFKESAGMNFLYTWCGIVCLFNVIFFFGTLANVYKVSKEVHQKLGDKVELRRHKWFRRWLRSCPILRIYFGGSNYMEELTPLNIEDFVINQTVSLLLLK